MKPSPTLKVAVEKTMTRKPDLGGGFKGAGCIGFGSIFATELAQVHA